MKLTLYKYISNEIWPTFLAGLLVSVFIIIATRMVPITEMIASQGVSIVRIIRMIVYLLPEIIVFALPAATLMAMVTAFLRLSADSEIIALKSCGISLYQMLPPVIAIAFAGLVIAGLTSIFAVPWGNNSFKELVFQIAESKADLAIRERIFCEPFDNVVFYVNNFSSKNKIMKDVFAVDSRDKTVTNSIVAEQARIFLHRQQKIITIQFVKGTMFLLGQKLQSARTISFNTYDLNIGLKDIMSALKSRAKDPKEMSLSELTRRMKVVSKGSNDYNEMMIYLLEKFSIPIGVFLMGIIGVPLGAQIMARGRSTGIGVSLIVFFVYYACLAGMRSICEPGIIPPVLGVWIPDIILLLSCGYLLRRVSKERHINLFFRRHE